MKKRLDGDYVEDIMSAINSIERYVDGFDFKKFIRTVQ